MDFLTLIILRHLADLFNRWGLPLGLLGLFLE